jgi:glycosyltransferase involved in cell wall biosynthesis
MSVLVSVVIPVYNSQDYISDCLDSVLSQTYKSYEIIAIDDGSTDSSLDILKSYQKSKGIKLFHIENSGQSVARNIGIENAIGKYLVFIDSDDCWCKNTLEVVVSLAENEKLDMVFFDGETFVDQKITDEASKEHLNKYFNTVFKPDTYVRNLPEHIRSGIDYLSYQLDCKRFIASPVLYLYKVDKFKHIKFIPGIIHEDNAFTMDLLVNNGKVMAIGEKLYRRRIRNDSIMTKPKTMENVLGYLGAIQRMGEVYNLTLDKKIQKIIINMMHMTLSKCASTLSKVDDAW